jgi:hypothetical protein
VAVTGVDLFLLNSPGFPRPRGLCFALFPDSIVGFLRDTLHSMPLLFLLPLILPLHS